MADEPQANADVDGGGSPEPQVSQEAFDKVLVELQSYKTRAEAAEALAAKKENDYKQQVGRAKRVESSKSEVEQAVADLQAQITAKDEALSQAQKQIEAARQVHREADVVSVINELGDGVLVKGASNVLRELLLNRTEYKDGKSVVSGGDVYSKKTGERKSLAELRDELIEQYPWMQSAKSGGGSGDAGNTGGTSKLAFTREQFEAADSYERAKMWEGLTKEQKALFKREGA